MLSPFFLPLLSLRLVGWIVLKAMVTSISLFTIMDNSGFIPQLQASVLPELCSMV